MLLQATSPLVETQHIDEAIKRYEKSGADSLIALVRQLKFLWKQNEDGSVEPINYNPLKRPRRQDFKGILTEPGAFYLTTRTALLESRCRISGRIIMYELPDELYFDLDTLLDWEIINLIMNLRRDRRFDNA